VSFQAVIVIVNVLENQKQESGDAGQTVCQGIHTFWTDAVTRKVQELENGVGLERAPKWQSSMVPKMAPNQFESLETCVLGQAIRDCTRSVVIASKCHSRAGRALEALRLSQELFPVQQHQYGHHEVSDSEPTIYELHRYHPLTIERKGFWRLGKRIQSKASNNSRRNDETQPGDKVILPKNHSRLTVIDGSLRPGSGFSAKLCYGRCGAAMNLPPPSLG
jgi:hypothetical protein